MIMKTVVLGREKAKDAYDIYFILKYYKDRLKALAKEFAPVSDRNLVIEMKERLNSNFASELHAGSKDVTDLLDLEDDEEIEMIKREAYEQVNPLIRLK